MVHGIILGQREVELVLWAAFVGWELENEAQSRVQAAVANRRISIS